MSVIIMAGMIGVGKSTMTGILSKELKTKAFYEPVKKNPMLPLYYDNPKRYGFGLQIYFLNQRFRMIKKALEDNNNILDRSIFEDALFTEENYESGNMLEAEYNIYLDLLDNMMSEINSKAKSRPDLLVFLDADFETILHRIKKRGREFEQVENNEELKDYYYRIWNKYKKWFDNYDISPKIKIDLENHDLENEKDKKLVIDLIKNKLGEI